MGDNWKSICSVVEQPEKTNDRHWFGWHELTSCFKCCLIDKLPRVTNKKENNSEKEITLIDFFATWSRAFPWASKILQFAFKRSFLSMPSLLGIAPSRKAASHSLNATSGTAVATTSKTNWNFPKYQNEQIKGFQNRWGKYSLSKRC